MKKIQIRSLKLFCALLLIAASDKSAVADADLNPTSNSDKPGSAERELRGSSSAGEEEQSKKNYRISDIRIKGNAGLDNKLVLTLFGMGKGDFFTEKRCEEGIEKLINLSSVKNAYLKRRYNHKESSLSLTLSLEKDRTFSIYPAGSRKYSDKLSVGLMFSERNFRNRNEKLNISFLVRGAAILDAEWRKPRQKDISPLGLSFNVKFKDYKYPYPEFEQDMLNDRIKRLESAVTVCFHFSDLFSINISPGIDRMFGEGPVLKQNSAEKLYTQSHEGLFSTLEISLRAGELNNAIYPTSGLRLRLSRKEWGLFNKNSGIKSHKYFFRGSLFFRIKRPVFFLHTRSVISSSRLPLILLEHLGGETSIRGYEFGAFRGENSFLTRYEIRFPLNFANLSEAKNVILPVDFNIFADTGMCWYNDDSITKDILHSGFGCGVNLIAPGRGIMRIGCMWKIESAGKLYLDVGMNF
ncbi:MAG: BamA/TamA family outer membrane protein [Candidatus Krumholzibacteriota bacterium]|nr:BamA/TamA family outer membrane protein [Candidatus Krumholzibacteriota bacterium]